MTSQAETRTALLDAGVRLYGSNAAELLKGLSAGAVADEAGFHRQTFYRYWETQAEYVQDLVRHALDPGDSPVADAVTELPSTHPPADLEDVARDLAHHDFARVLEDPAVMLRVGLVAMQALDEGQAQRCFEVWIDRVAEGYDELFATLGLEPADGTSTRDVARTLQALLLGLVLEAKFAKDETHGAELLERATLVLLEGLTQPVASEASATG